MCAETTITRRFPPEKTQVFCDLPWIARFRQELPVDDSFIAKLEKLFIDWKSGSFDPHVRDLCKYSDRLVLVAAAVRFALTQRGFDHADFHQALPKDSKTSMYTIDAWLDRIAQQLLLQLKYPEETEAIGILPIGLGSHKELLIHKFLPGAYSSFAMVAKEAGAKNKWFVKTAERENLLRELANYQTLKQAGAAHVVGPSFYTDISAQANDIVLKQPQLPFADAAVTGSKNDTFAFFEYLDDNEWQNLELRALPGEQHRRSLTIQQIAQFIEEFATEQLSCAKQGVVLQDRLAKNVMVKCNPNGTLDWKNVDLGIMWTTASFKSDGESQLQRVAINQTFALLWYTLLADQFSDVSVIVEMRETMLTGTPIDPLHALVYAMSDEQTLNDETRKEQLTQNLYAKLMGCKPSELTELQYAIARRKCALLARLADQFFETYYHKAEMLPEQMIAEVVKILRDPTYPN